MKYDEIMKYVFVFELSMLSTSGFKLYEQPTKDAKCVHAGVSVSRARFCVLLLPRHGLPPNTIGIMSQLLHFLWNPHGHSSLW